MIIKGNSVGHPLPDPRKGLNMTGSINMNLKRLFGVKTPVEADDAANKGYVDAHINDTGNPHKTSAAQVGAAPASHVTDQNNPHKVTAADVGAIPGTHAKWLPQHGMSILSFPDGITSYSVNPGNMIAEGAPDGFSEYATVTVFKLTEYPYYEYIDVFGNKAIWKANGGGWDTFYSNNFKPTPAAIGAVTEAQVTTMINNALGVIENGTY